MRKISRPKAPVAGNSTRLVRLLVLFLLLAGPLGCQVLRGSAGNPRQESKRDGQLTVWLAPRQEGGAASTTDDVPQRQSAVIQASAAEKEPAPTNSIQAQGAHYSIDLQTTLRLAGADNPTIALAREAVAASRAEQLQAQALLLPSLNAGVGYNDHQGPLETSTGVILKVTRQSLYDGAGAAAVGAGTVGIPGVHFFANLADAALAPRAARERVVGRSYDAQATRNAILLEAVSRYFELAGATARLQAARQSEGESEQVALMTSEFAMRGQGRPSDAERARDNTLLLHEVALQVEGETAVAAAALAQVLDMDPAVRLRTDDGPPPAVQLVDPQTGLETLVKIALDGRPEIAARSADVSLNETLLRQERLRPFLPVLSVGYSAGQFGGGGDFADTRLGHFSGRTDFDAYAFWSLENFGVGNWARQQRRRAQVVEAEAERLRTIDRIRREVADALALSATRLGEVERARRRVETSTRSFQADLARARNLEGRAIEVLDSVNSLAAARQDLIRALAGYDIAQFQLFVALGRPPSAANYLSSRP